MVDESKDVVNIVTNTTTEEADTDETVGGNMELDIISNVVNLLVSKPEEMKIEEAGIVDIDGGKMELETCNILNLLDSKPEETKIEEVGMVCKDGESLELETLTCEVEPEEFKSEESGTAITVVENLELESHNVLDSLESKPEEMELEEAGTEDLAKGDLQSCEARNSLESKPEEMKIEEAGIVDIDGGKMELETCNIINLLDSKPEETKIEEVGMVCKHGESLELETLTCEVEPEEFNSEESGTAVTVVENLELESHNVLDSLESKPEEMELEEAGTEDLAKGDLQSCDAPNLLESKPEEMELEEAGTEEPAKKNLESCKAPNSLESEPEKIELEEAETGETVKGNSHVESAEVPKTLESKPEVEPMEPGVGETTTRENLEGFKVSESSESNPEEIKPSHSKDVLTTTGAQSKQKETPIVGSSFQTPHTRTYGSTKILHSRACCNDQCEHISDEIVTAPSHVLFYFGVVSSARRNHKICTQCLEKAEAYLMESIEACKKKEPVYDIPFKSGCVTTIDLDEESDSEEDKEMVEVEENFEEEMDAMIKSLGMDILVTNCAASLEKDFDELDESFKGISKIFQQADQDLESARKEYDKLTGPKYDVVTLNSLDIDVFGNTKIVVAPKPDFSTRRVPRKAVNLNPVTSKGSIDDGEICELTSMGPPTVRRAVLAATPAVIPRVMPKVGDRVFVMRTSTLNFWVRGEILDVYQTSQIEFKVQFELTKKGRPVPVSNSKDVVLQVKVMTAKHIAYNLPCPFVLPVATRVIALFKDVLNTEPYGNGNYYAGVVAEPPKSQNGYRYLIFFDDGYAQYVGQNDVFLVCEASKDVWLDVHPDSQQFIKNYVSEYPERPMLRLQKGTVVTTEWNGKWWVARVTEVDGSLAKMSFEADNRSEWIYRGSTRLSPLYHKLKRQNNGRRHNFSTARFGNNSRIEYTYGTEDIIPECGNRIARKSTGAAANVNGTATTFRNPRPSGISSSTGLLEYEGKMQRVGIPKSVPPSKPFVNHQCDASCVRTFVEDSKDLKTLNPLSIPLWLGFTREVGKTPRRTIFYRAPCGRRLRDYTELQTFLVETGYNMSIDYFCFDFSVDCLSEFIPSRQLFTLPDITYGKEMVKVQCVNSIDHDYPEYLDYTKERLPSKDVVVNLDEDFLACCDCEDDCLDKDKCSCWQLTLEGIKKCALDIEPGYQHRRLYDHIVSGIYECNQGCKCKKTCSNRVAQNPMRWQLQVFKTSTKGWAIRPLHDIPQGSFICVYAGQILTEQGANEDGKEYGDEYLAELDYIEVMESIKEGYEHDVIEPSQPRFGSRKVNIDTDSNYMEDSEEDSSGEEDGHAKDKDYRARTISPQRTIATRRSDTTSKDEETRSTTCLKEDDSVDNDHDDGNVQRTPSKFAASFSTDLDSKSSDAENRVLTRQLFGPDEQCYIMDAKGVGNIGRYLNHSCQPNVFVQNVFVDTHDLRFPWVAFFAYKHIRAGTELTWDYNYDIGSVPDKTMYCYCGAPECRGRLL